MAAQLLPHFTPSEQITPSFLNHFVHLGSPTLSSFYPLWAIYPLTLTTFYPPLQPSSYLILHTVNKLHPHFYTILSPLAAQLLAHFTPSEEITPHSYTILSPSLWQPSSNLILLPLNSLLTHSYNILSPLAAQLLAHFTPSEQFTHSLLHHFSPSHLGIPVLTSFYPLWTIFLQYFTPLAAQLLPRFSPSEQFTHSLLQLFIPLAAQLLPHFTPSEQITPSFLNHFVHLGSPTLSSFYPLWAIYPLTLKTFYPPLKPSSYLILHTVNKLHPHFYTILSPLAAQLSPHLTPSEQKTPHSYTILSPLAAQLLAHFTPSEQFTHSLLHHFTPSHLGIPVLTSFYPLWRIYSLTLTIFYTLGSPALTSF